MSKKFFTPKPWHAEFSKEDESWQVVFSPFDDVLAIVLTDNESISPDHDGESNARLIAAAPELLEACERAADEGCDMSEGYRISRSTLELLVGAIKRAKGEIE